MLKDILSYGKNKVFWIIFFVVSAYFVFEYNDLPLNSSTTLLFLLFPAYMLYLSMSSYRFLLSLQHRQGIFYIQSALGVLLVGFVIVFPVYFFSLFKAGGYILNQYVKVNIFYIDLSGFMFFCMSLLASMGVWIPVLFVRVFRYTKLT